MGAIKASKMPKKKVITRKDDPNQVDYYAAGGSVKPRKKKRSGFPSVKPFTSQNME
jgi:hypothetical protein